MTFTLNPHRIEDAKRRLVGIAKETPLQFNRSLSAHFGARIYLKREDLQAVRSYKLRGAYNRMAQLTTRQKKRGVVCASAGNHAQGVAFSCAHLQIQGLIFMPKNTPRQKIDRVHSLGGEYIRVELYGDTFDEAYAQARSVAKKQKKAFVHPFNDPEVIAGQGTVGAEILEQAKEPIDFVIMPVGGGGLASGVGTYIRFRSPHTKVIGVEPSGAPSMQEAFKKGKATPLASIDTFVDGAAVKMVGDRTFAICKKVLNKLLLVSEGKVCETMIELYQRDGIVAEPAGALSVAVLSELRAAIKGKTVVCVISGGNNDISRYADILERSLVYRGLKHYFILNFSQRPGAFRQYLNTVLGPTDDITFFEYVKKNNRENGPALIGVELAKKSDFKPLLKRMNKFGVAYEVLEKESTLFRFLI